MQEFINQLAAMERARRRRVDIIWYDEVTVAEDVDRILKSATPLLDRFLNRGKK